MILHFISVLSLKKLCLIKTAMILCYHPKMKTAVEKYVMFSFSFDKRTDSLLGYLPACFTGREGERILLKESDHRNCDRVREMTHQQCLNGLDKFVEKKISVLLLPLSLQQELLICFYYITQEITKWIKRHYSILSFSIIRQCNFYWKSHGKIDKEKTAKCLIGNENLCISERYALASLYGFRDDAFLLWNSMTLQEKYLIGEKFPHLRVWNGWMDGETMDWDNLSVNAPWNSYYYLGVRTLFTKLSEMQKLPFLKYSVIKKTIDCDDFLFCLSVLNVQERHNFLKECPCQVLEYFLDWPLRSAFQEVANNLYSYLSGGMFFVLLNFIIYHRIARKRNDLDFYELLNEFWRRSPNHLKEYIKQKNIYEALMDVISGNSCRESVEYCNDMEFSFRSRKRKNIC